MNSPPQTAGLLGPGEGGSEMYAALLQGEYGGDAALRASQQMLQILMDSMTNAVFWKDRQSRYLGCNKVFASFAGVEPEAMVGLSDRDMPWADDPEFDADWFVDWDQVVVESGEPRFGIIERLRSAAGEVRWIETNKVPLRDLSGAVIGVLGTFEDVTERRVAEDNLQRTLAELDERVKQRTTQLMRSNESLRREVEDRVRIQAEERQQRSYAEALSDSAAAMSSTLDLDEVMEHVLGGVERLVSNDLTAIILLDQDGTPYVARQRVGFGYGVAIESHLSESLSSLDVIGRLAAGVGSIVIDDPQRALGPAQCVVGAPMRIGDQQIGFLVAESAMKGFFTDGHGDRLRAIADQAAAAISNARFAGQVSGLAAAEERQRLARELHDAVNQTLWTAALTADSLLREAGEESALRPRLERLRQLTRGALAEMRTLVLELRPAELSEAPLHELLAGLVTALESRKFLQVTVALDPVEFDSATRLAFYRVAQEALGNIAKHTQATEVEITLSSGENIELRIRDNGGGFDPDAVPAGHLGLIIMRERAEAVGAKLEIDAVPGRGTDLRLSVAGI
ncbi:MAG TPA: PAS domain-containing protein [Ilumatobacteraceae bacterium]|nr:PAS domain-containing protein [Ilumatobacteraceae bacterium]